MYAEWYAGTRLEQQRLDYTVQMCSCMRLANLESDNCRSSKERNFCPRIRSTRRRQKRLGKNCLENLWIQEEDHGALELWNFFHVMREGEAMRTDLHDWFCCGGAGNEDSGVAERSAVCVCGCRSLWDNVGCETEKVSRPTAFLLELGGDREFCMSWFSRFCLVCVRTKDWSI